MLFSILFHFFPTAIDSHGTVPLVLGLVAMHSVAAFMWMVIKFSYSSCVFLMSPEEYQT